MDGKKFFSQRICEIVQSVPEGKVATYGQIAAMAGNPKASRIVVRALRTYSGKYRLPWHRIVNSQGGISLPPGDGREEQVIRLLEEGVRISPEYRIDLKLYRWNPGKQAPA